MTLGQEKQGRGQAGKKGPAILPFTPNRVLRLYLGGHGIDKLEKRGVVSGPLPGGSKREILITDGIEVQQQP